MLKSMTGFSKSETSENNIKAIIELKSLNGRYLDINCRMPRHLGHYELELRDIIKKSLDRGSVSVNVFIEKEAAAADFSINEKAAAEVFSSLNSLKKSLKIREAVKLEHLLQFSQSFTQKPDDDTEKIEIKIVKAGLRKALKTLDNMRNREGREIEKDLNKRMQKIQSEVDKIQDLSINKIPDERERLRQRIAQLFESDEIDEQRLQMEMVLLADKLDISEECVRLNSHIKFFFKELKVRDSSGRKINFLLQEMHREINTIGSKANDAEISQLVVSVKEELERIREQVQNIE